METLLAEIQGNPLAQFLRFDRWGYAAVNGTHIFAISLLIGSILPLDLRLLGAWSSVPRAAMVRVLVPVAASGLALALTTGTLLFTVKADVYANNGFFLAKLVLVAAGVTGALSIHAAHGFLLETASRRRLAVHALISLACWVGALACGRLIAFTSV